MARRWTPREEEFYREQLRELYVDQNKTIFETAGILELKWQTVFRRLKRLEIPTIPQDKENYLNKRSDVKIPTEHSDDLAEFFGVMLGDGHLSISQVTVTLGTKELGYAKHVADLIRSVFGPLPKLFITKRGYIVLYLGSVDIVRWLKEEGLVFNKVGSQVDVPHWIFTKESYAQRFVQGFFDTDGSIYKLKYGIQISFTNASEPMLKSLQRLCIALGYRVSAISGWHFYITKIGDIRRFFREIAPQNDKHEKRFAAFLESYKQNHAQVDP